MTSLGVDSNAVEIDITNDASVNSAARELETKYGKIDALINFAGMMVHSAATVADKNLSERSQGFDTNVTGTWRVYRY